MASRCAGAFRSFSRQTATPRCLRGANSARWLATATEPTSKSTPLPHSINATSKPAISRIVDDISSLTLLQAVDLVTELKTRLNIQEIALPAAGVAAPQAAAPAVDEPAVEKTKEKTVFNVRLESFDAGSKPKVIREVKALVPNLTLIDAKKFVESLPKVLKENLSKDDAEKLQKTFEAIGAIVKLD